jgi:hypothetical protein
LNGDRRRIDEAARHDKADADVWGELTYARDGRRSGYLISHRARGGWSACFWKRWVPATNHQVRPPGMFERGP